MSFLEIKILFLGLFSGISSDIKANCEILTAVDLLPRVQISSSEPVSDRRELPEFCQIKGEIRPNIGFEARLPITGWNGKYFQAGCGGYCGQILPDRETHSNAINHALRRGYATITTDGGHQSHSIGDASWATNHEVERIYASEVIPLTYAAALEIIDKIYGRKPSYSYFSGCSNGGRLAAKAAQEYPSLFNGIISGCPVLNLSGSGGILASHVLRANLDASGETILDEKFKAKLPMLEKNSIAQCDALDGNIDGAIQKPQDCFVILNQIPDCDHAETPSCLTVDEKKVVRKLYDGPVNSAGEKLFYGIPPGSERYWEVWHLGNKEKPSIGTLLAEGFLPFLGFPEDPDGFNATDFDLDNDISKLDAQGRLLDALNPDLKAFSKAGGKMIMWHGQADPLVLHEQSIDYYTDVVDKLGKNTTDDFFRLFLVPTMGHCWELPAKMPDRMNMLQVLENWVENGSAPDEIIARSNDDDGHGSLSGKIGKLRPYPSLASYSDQN
ncbi:MAG: tannase/feruloyl esterase family alpha/beta hydrolase [Cellvibrionales bacterium TMED148]|nr:hypothetical protein [Porticoccaceae bacterium]RPG90497.1 MAG: tannase/feruloyl esterase family alpha/beta hydrolase [Cellvibrionales bacterium TMED148]